MTKPPDATSEDVLSFIETYTEMFGFAPSQREIAKACHISKGTVENTLFKLENRHLIRRVPGQARAITVLT